VRLPCWKARAEGIGGLAGRLTWREGVPSLGSSRGGKGRNVNNSGSGESSRERNGGREQLRYERE